MKHRLWSSEEIVSFSHSRPSLAGYGMRVSHLPSLILLSVSCCEKWRCSTSKLTHRVVGRIQFFYACWTVGLSSLSHALPVGHLASPNVASEISQRNRVRKMGVFIN